MIKKIYAIITYQGISGLLNAVFSRVLPRRLTFYKHCKSFFESKTGLEIGGPSGIFRRTGLIPVYTVAARIDNCNFGNHTIWEGKINYGDTIFINEERLAANTSPRRAISVALRRPLTISSSRRTA